MHGTRSPGRTIGLARAALIAACTGASAVAGSFVAAGLSGAFVGTAVADGLLGVLPNVVFAYGITTLGNAAQPLLLAGATALAAVGLAAAALFTTTAVDRAWRRSGRTGSRIGLAVAGLAVGLLASVLVALVTGSIGSGAGAGIAAASTTAAGRSADIGRGRLLHADDEGSENSEADRLLGKTGSERRPLLRAAGVLAGALAASGLAASRRDDFAPADRSPNDPRNGVDDPLVLALLDRAERRSFDFDAVDPLVSRGFYKVDINLTEDPEIAPEEWSLSVRGAVDDSLSLDYASVTGRPTEHRFVTLRCVGDGLNGYKIDTALWTGTPLAPILDEAGAGEECCVRLAAADGYYHAFPRAALERGFLAWGMNGKPLPQAHGAPVRVLIPGHWGEINVKWVTDIEVRDEPATGYWEERGWHGSGPVETVAKIHTVTRRGDATDGSAESGDSSGEAGRVIVGGHAYAGTRGIDRVEVSTDGGETWTDATLSEPLPGATPADGAPASDPADDAWRMWRHEYVDPSEHEVTARVVEADGTVQPAEESSAFPRGATGWVSREVYAVRE
ncbi:molybdopterin-dependent oxidoreductase [Haloparvum sedimenti]|uniref:molybdopterin-dependent oxidoreductase n=1 Tax=Haloparvum sedimenti TaxID=1678448 RepID=UPI00071E73AE|nr:molybdopterin-dependent oxidoreductase [Haloparvum sedimenti]